MGQGVRRPCVRYARGFPVAGWQLGAVRNLWPRLGVIFEGETLMTVLTEAQVEVLEHAGPVR
jgi:hypothetical protein